MAFSSAVGEFLVPAAAGNVTVSGLGFQPKAVIFFTSDQSATGFNANAEIAIGFQSSDVVTNSARGYSYWTQQDAEGYPYTGTGGFSGVANSSFYHGPATFNGYVSAYGADGFTATFSVANGSYTNKRIHYMALGGSDITDTKALQFNWGASTGNVSFTGYGFKPDVLLFIGNSFKASPGGGGPFFGAATATGQMLLATGHLAYSFTGTASLIKARTLQRTDACMGLVDNSGNIDALASLVSMDADGFTLNVSDAPGYITNPTIAVLALKGSLAVKVGSFLKATVTGNQAVTGVGGSPSALLMASSGKAASASLTVDAEASFGIVKTGTERTLWFEGRDNLLPTEENRYSANKALSLCTGPSTVDAESNLTSMDADGFTLNWTTNNATAAEILYLAFGVSAAAADSQPMMFVTT